MRTGFGSRNYGTSTTLGPHEAALENIAGIEVALPNAEFHNGAIPAIVVTFFLYSGGSVSVVS